ncbi:hypothetical protein CCACVL1_16663 [Corchorus capsularis]|uniref:Uncharacterized protein n=1 Tax=Corchorus capsularis TaxID=210143 RepID=A0A1R3HW51_COCAP|nr:hypothetical protein CCACVL1_16663 [Corchorus capsularis]
MEFNLNEHRGSLVSGFQLKAWASLVACFVDLSL